MQIYNEKNNKYINEYVEKYKNVLSPVLERTGTWAPFNNIGAGSAMFARSARR